MDPAQEQTTEKNPNPAEGVDLRDDNKLAASIAAVQSGKPQPENLSAEDILSGIKASSDLTKESSTAHQDGRESAPISKPKPKVTEKADEKPKEGETTTDDKSKETLEVSDLDDIDAIINDPLISGKKKEEKPKEDEKSLEEKEDEEVTLSAEDEKDQTKVKSAFQKLNQQLKAAKRKLIAAQKSTTGEVPEATKTEIETLRKDREELQDKIQKQENFVQMANLEMSEEFQQNIIVPKTALKQRLIDVAQANNVDPRALYSAVQGDRAKLVEFTKEMNQLDVAELGTIRSGIIALNQAEKSLRDNAGEAMKRFTKARQDNHIKQTREQRESYVKGIDQAVEETKSEFPSLYAEVDDESWKASTQVADQVLERLKGIHPSQLSPDDFGKLVGYAQAFQRGRSYMSRQTQVIERLKTALIKSRGAAPKVGGSQQTTPPPTGGKSVPAIAEFLSDLTSRFAK